MNCKSEVVPARPSRFPRRCDIRQLNLRFANAAEPEFKEWIQANPENEFDKSILYYPTLQIFCAYDAESRQPVAYLPIQRAIILESTAIKPGLSPADSAQALRDMVKATQLIASSHGVKEIYLMGNDEKLNAMAANHNFKQEDWKVFRMRIQ